MGQGALSWPQGLRVGYLLSWGGCFLRFLSLIVSHSGFVGVKLLGSQPHATEVSQTLLTNQNFTSTDGGFFIFQSWVLCLSLTKLSCVKSGLSKKKSVRLPMKLWVRTRHLLCVNNTSHSLFFSLHHVPASREALCHIFCVSYVGLVHKSYLIAMVFSRSSSHCWETFCPGVLINSKECCLP